MRWPLAPGLLPTPLTPKGREARTLSSLWSHPEDAPMEGTKVFHLWGVNYRTAPVAVREAWHFTSPKAHALLRRTAGALPGLEAVVLSTCNRTEFYLAAEAGTLA